MDDIDKLKEDIFQLRQDICSLDEQISLLVKEDIEFKDIDKRLERIEDWIQEHKWQNEKNN